MRVSKLWTAPSLAVRSLLLLFVTYLPGPFGNWVRGRYYRRRLKRCGQRVIIDTGVLLDHPELISLGDDVHIDKYCVISTGLTLQGRVRYLPNPAFGGSPGEIRIGNDVHVVQQCILMGYGGIEIGDNCTLSAGCKLYSLTNQPYDPDDRSRVLSIMPYGQAPFLCGPIVLRKNVWLGLQVIVMPGVEVGRDSFASTNSLVMSSFGPNSYLRGQPAIRARDRFEALP